jgi:hypothetical protein
MPRGGKRSGAGRKPGVKNVWHRDMLVWLLIEYYTLIAGGMKSEEALQRVAYRRKKEFDHAIGKKHLTMARREVSVSDLPPEFQVDIRRMPGPLSLAGVQQYMAEAAPFDSLAEWMQYMVALGAENRKRFRETREKPWWLCPPHVLK